MKHRDAAPVAGAWVGGKHGRSLSGCLCHKQSGKQRTHMSARFLSSFPRSPEESYSKSNIRSHWLRRRDDNEPIFCVSVCDYRQNKQSKKKKNPANSQSNSCLTFLFPFALFLWRNFTSLGWHKPPLVTSNLALPAYPHYQQTNNEQWQLWSIQTNLHTHKSLISTYPRHIKR